MKRHRARRRRSAARAQAARHRARRRRRLRRQEPPDAGGHRGRRASRMKVGHPVRWIEDRREHLLASVHARDHSYDLTISADRDGTPARPRGRRLYRCRRLRAVADRLVHGSEHGVAQPHRALSHPPPEARTPSRSPPTRRRWAPIAASRGRARALRSSGWSTRSRASSGASRSTCGGRTSSPPPSCPTRPRPA